MTASPTMTMHFTVDGIKSWLDHYDAVTCEATYGSQAPRQIASQLIATMQREARLLEELDAYRHAAQYDALMSGPRFNGWNRSALDRARRLTEARIEQRSDYP